MDQSEEAAFTVVENWWKKSFDISKNADDPLFSLYTKSFETIMVYMSQSLDYEYIEREISSLDKDRQLALQFENGYDAHRCLSFGLIEAVQMIMKKNTKKLEETIKQGYIPVPEIPKFPLEPKEEEIKNELESIPAENKISSPSLPKVNTEQPIYDVSQDFSADDQNTGMDDFAPEIDNTFCETPLEDAIMDEPDRTIPDESSPMVKENARDNDEMMNDNDLTDSSLNQPMKEERKSTRRVTRPAKYNSMEDSDEEEVEPIMKKTRLNSTKKIGEDSSRVKCVLCEKCPKTASGYANHLDNVHKTTLNANGIYLLCLCSLKISSVKSGYKHSKDCDGFVFTVHKKEDEIHTTPQCILCEMYPKTPYGYAIHFKNVHKSTLNANGIYLSCSCGFNIRSHHGGENHIKDCDEPQFSVHKLIEE